MKAAVSKKIEQAKARDTLGRNLAPCIYTDGLGTRLWDTQMSTGSNHSTKLTPVVLVDDSNRTYILQYVITRIVSSSHFEDVLTDIKEEDGKEEDEEND